MRENLGKYLKFSLCNGICLLTLGCIYWGGPWLWLPFAVIVLAALIGDGLLPADETAFSEPRPWILNSFLYANLPLLIGASTLFMLRVGLYGEAAALSEALASWLLPATRLGSASSALDLWGGGVGLGLLYGVAATNVAHELVHRTWSPLAQSVGRWLLAFTWDGEFAIEHVYGHHRKVATTEDPASARRGETFYAFFWRSLIEGNRSAWQIEKAFLKKRSKKVFSSSNRLLRGWLISLGMAGAAYLLAGPLGLAAHALLAFYGKFYLELVNYIEHYGLVRLPKTPVQTRHSWNSNAPISSWFLYNLPRHSHHHAVGHLPFWKLNAEASAPTLPFGYMAMIIIALFPPLFKKVMEPHLAQWDLSFASSEERAIAQEPAVAS